MSRLRVDVKPKCNKCGVDLTEDNWQPSFKKGGQHVCRACNNARANDWKRKHPEQHRAQARRSMAAWAERQSPVAHGDPSKVYYCYEIYTILPSGRRRTLYIGKGKNGRMYVHEKIYRRKLKKARPNLDPKEKLFLFVEDMGCTLYTAVFASGLSEDEAFNREHDEIMRVGLENLGNVAYPHRPRLIK